MLASTVVAEAPVTATAFPGLNGRIYCATSRTGNQDIFAFDPNGVEAPVQITSNLAFDFDPTLRSDGRLMAFASTRDDPAGANQEIYIQNADGSGPATRLTFAPGEDRPGSFHPDGSQIVFHRFVPGFDFEIFKINVDGTGETRLTFSSARDSLPSWSPDGTKIAFTRNFGGDFEIWTMDPFGGNLTQVTFSPGEDSAPQWSPDGSQIVFQSRRAPVPPGDIRTFKMNADGSNVTMLSDGFFDIFPVWSPDSTKIAFHSFRDDRVTFTRTDVYVMNADGSNEVNISPDPPADQRCDWQPLCTIYGSGSILGTEGNDVICGSEGPDRIVGGGGNDIVYGFGGDDSVSAGEGNDRVFGGTGNDSLSGQGGVDFLSAGYGNDRIVADRGEVVDPGAGPDFCFIGGVAGCPPRLS